MIVARTRDELNDALKGSGKVGFVPTMGALHAGHLALLETAKRETETAVCSIFVNPTQFGPNEDFSKYPRDEDRDFALAKSAGCDVMFFPGQATIYAGSHTTVRVSDVSRRYEGAVRPGHFEGVATVVHKLFGLVKPDVAYFGLKDIQQCAVVGQMVRDLFLPVDVRYVETVREASGLALSSRNAYLSQSDREKAATIYRVLCSSADEMRMNSNPSETATILTSAKQSLVHFGFLVDYLDLVDPLTMTPLDCPKPNSRLIVAARLSRVRLLDNVALFETPFLTRA